MRDAFAKELESLINQDSSIMFLTGDLGFGVFNSLRESFPENFINVGVAEQNMVGIASGMALEGHKVFTYSIGNFPTLRCLEQIRNDACYHQLNVNVISVGGGFSYGPLGMSHHATEDLSIMRCLPNTTVLSPGTKFEAVKATKAVIETPGVSYIRLDKSDFDDKNGFTGGQFQIGKSRIMKEGKDISLFASGGILEIAMEVAKNLDDKGISCRVLSFSSIKPIDKEEIIWSANNTQGIFTLEENNILGGLGGAVAEVCLESGNIPKVFSRFGIPDEYPVIVGSQEYLRKAYNLDVDSVVKRIMDNL